MKEGILSFLAWGGRKLRRSFLARSKLLNQLLGAVAFWLHGKDTAQVGEFDVRFHPQDRTLARRLILYGTHEQVGIELLCSLASEGDTVLDIGANIGLFTMHFSQAVGPRGRVLAVEPEPGTVEVLRRNIEENGCRNVMVLPIAFGETSRNATLFVNPRHRATASFARLGKEEQYTVEVPVRRGEDVLKELDCSSQPRVVKIDVEGAEPEVVQGLGYYPEILLFECVPKQIQKHGHDPLEFLQSLESVGYELALIDPDNGALQHHRVKELIARTDASHRNILALKKSDHNDA